MEDGKLRLAKYDGMTLSIMVKEDNEKITMRTNDAIVLCSLVKDFDKFRNNLNSFASGVFAKFKLEQLYNYVTTVDPFTQKSIKKFYQDNWIVLDILLANNCVEKFLFKYFDYKTGEFDKNILGMYNYLKENIDNICVIFDLLFKLRELGFDEFTMDENNKFDDEHILENIKAFNADFYYSDGDVYTKPSLNGMKYSFKNSNYQVDVNTLLNNGQSKKCFITLNNLLFNGNKIINNSDEIIQKLYQLKDEKTNDYKTLETLVQYDYYLNNISDMSKRLDNIIDNNKLKNKSDISRLINEIKSSCLGLKVCLSDNENQIVDNNILEEKDLEEEKNIYKKKQEKVKKLNFELDN